MLSNGQWYKVAKDFVQSVNEAIAKIPEYEKTLAEFDDDREEDYIRRVAGMDPTLAMMDQKFISVGGGSNKMELCDLYSSSRDLIHLKRKGASSTYSHLFNQGFVAAELFKINPEFRQKANAELPSSHRIFDPGVAPGPDEYRVVFGVITHEPGPLSFPFFSRVSLKHHYAIRR